MTDPVPHSMYLRVIFHKKSSPFYNMAVDEAISVTCEKNNFIPVLRFYEWAENSVSIGYFQKMQEVEKKLPSTIDYTIVRRPTGGGAVIHNDDITFSLTAAENFFEGPVINSYNMINKSIIDSIDIDGKNMLGLLKTKNSSVLSSPLSSKFCFKEPSKYDILWDNLKVGGSAQRRKNKIVLHQSSFFYKKLLKNNKTIQSLKPDFIEMIVRGLSEMLNLSYKKSDLFNNEQEQAKFLLSTKYNLNKWNFMR